MRKRAGTATIAYRVRITAPPMVRHNYFIHFSLAFLCVGAIMMVGKGYELISIQTKRTPYEVGTHRGFLPYYGTAKP